MSITPYKFTQAASGLQTGAVASGGAPDQSGDFAYWERLFDAAQGQGLGAQHHSLLRHADQADAVPPTRGATSSAQHVDLSEGLVALTEGNFLGLEGGGEVAASRPSSAHRQLVGALPVQIKAGHESLGGGHGYPDEVPLLATRGVEGATSRLAFAPSQVLAPFEAHLHRNAQGGLLVTLRSVTGLSDAQALRAVAEALGREGQAGCGVACVLLNGRPIYQAAEGASGARSQFEIEC